MPFQCDLGFHEWKKVYLRYSEEVEETCELCGISRTRLSNFSSFVGQSKIKGSLTTLVAAAYKKGKPLHHLLLCGQPGMGKVTLAKIIASEMGVNTKIISGKTIKGAGDLAAILTNLRARDILIIEQIESVRKQVLEVLVPAMSEFTLDIVIGKGPSARNIALKLPPFTVIGTSSKPWQIDEHLNSLTFAFNFAPYAPVYISKILSLFATQQNLIIGSDAIDLIATQSNGCPSDMLLMLKKVREYAIAYTNGQFDSRSVREALLVFSTNNNSQPFERQPIPDDVKMFVWQRDGGHCAKCGSQEKLEYDHIIPVSKGGSNTARNIQLLCEKCNRSKGANII